MYYQKLERKTMYYQKLERKPGKNQ